MKIGVNTWVWTSPFTTDDMGLVHKAKMMGFDMLEVALDDPALIDASALRKAAEENEIELAICGAFGPNRDVSNVDAAIRQNGLEYMLSAIDFAESVGVRMFCGPVYSSVGRTELLSFDEKKRQREWCIENLRKAGEAAAGSGVSIAIEPLNRFETSMINLAEQALDLVQELDHPAFGIHLDTFHGNIEEKSMPAAIRTAGRHLIHFHACENDRGTPGTGNVDWIGVKRALDDVQYNGALVIESFTPGAVEIAKAAAIWRPLAVSQDDLAQDGARFLRELVG